MLNAQSIRSKFNEFECYVALEKPDIICVTETWVSEEFNGDRLQDFELRGYNMFSYCRAKRQGGGVFIYVNSSYSVSRVDDPSKAGSVESVWLDITTGAGNGGKLRIAGFYRAGNLSGNLQAELDQEICEELCRNFRTHCLIVGDFNLRGYEMGSEDTIECKTFRQIFEEELFMHQFVTEPTRHSSILDLVFSDNMDLVKDIVVSNGLGNSDHNMVKFKISSENRPKDNLILVPNFNRADFDSIRNELAQINWKVDMKNMNVLRLGIC